VRKCFGLLSVSSRSFELLIFLMFAPLKPLIPHKVEYHSKSALLLGFDFILQELTLFRN
jgi:hypothetical protein